MRVNVVVARVAVGLQERKGIRIRIAIAIKVRDQDQDQDEDLFLQCIRKKTLLAVQMNRFSSADQDPRGR